MSGALSFDSPLFFLGLLIFFPMIFYAHFSPQGKRIASVLPDPLRKRLFFSKAFFRIFIVCVIIALAGPRWGLGPAAGEFRRGVDAVIALDVSRSMEVCDVFVEDNEAGVSRLQRGLSIVREAVAAVPEIRYAAAVGKGRGIAAVPLTRDNGIVLDFLEAVDSASITGRGTNLESLVDAAATAFSASHPAVKVIVLVSDGEALSGSLKAAVTRCNQNGVTIAAVAVGSDNGGEVPVNADASSEVGPSNGGSPSTGGEVSRRDASAMRMAAGQTGRYFGGTGFGNAVFGTGYIDGNRRDAADALAAHLRSLAPESEISGNRKEPKARRFLFTILAIMALGASKLCLLKPRPGKQEYEK